MPKCRLDHDQSSDTLIDVAKEKPMPTEKTPQGLDVPIPKRKDFFANLKKAAKVGKPSGSAGSPKK